MITPETMAQLKKLAQEYGDRILQEITERDFHVYFDVALLAYMYHAHVAATLRNSLASQEQITDMISVIDEVGAFAKGEAEKLMLELGILRKSDG